MKIPKLPMIESTPSLCPLKYESEKTWTVISKISHKVAPNAKDIINDLEADFEGNRKGEVSRKDLLKGSHLAIVLGLKRATRKKILT